MTEAEWLACDDPRRMVAFLRGRASDRKLRLFACAYCRHPFLWEHWLVDGRSRRAIEAAERYVDGEATDQELYAARAAAWGPVRNTSIPVRPRVYLGSDYHLNKTAWAATRDGERAAQAAVRAGKWGLTTFQCDLLRDVFGPLSFRPVSLPPAVFTLDDRAVPRLAAGLYQEPRMPEGTLDAAGLAVLADGLEETGCTDAAVLAHLRSPGRHVRGCWVVDLVLGRG